MPRLRIPVLIHLLQNIQMNLFDIYLNTKVNEIGDNILQEREALIEIIKRLEEL